jgi:hypothetical protein
MPSRLIFWDKGRVYLYYKALGSCQPDSSTRAEAVANSHGHPQYCWYPIPMPCPAIHDPWCTTRQCAFNLWEAGAPRRHSRVINEFPWLPSPSLASLPAVFIMLNSTYIRTRARLIGVLLLWKGLLHAAWCTHASWSGLRSGRAPTSLPVFFRHYSYKGRWVKSRQCVLVYTLFFFMKLEGQRAPTGILLRKNTGTEYCAPSN